MKIKKKAIKKKKINWLPLSCLCLVIFAILFSLFYKNYIGELQKKYFKNINTAQYTKSLLLVNQNYGDSINKYANIYKLDSCFLKALVMLESGGQKVIRPRFEKHIFVRLKKLKNNEIAQYEGIFPKDFVKITDEKLKIYASSWGPFQLMGYQMIYMKKPVEILNKKEGIKYSIAWINKEYGHLIRAKKFKDAFHRHNTGSNYPKFGPPQTHDPQYVNKGLKFMLFYKKNA